jgi:hypothetical protein
MNTKHAGGRPLAFKTAKEMQEAIDEYFDNCDNRLVQGYDNKTNEQFAYISPEPYTMSGLAYALGIDRRTLLDYSERGEFLPTLKRARDRVQMDVERRLMEKAPTGAIFNLKNNFGWKDEVKQDITTDGKSLEGLVIVTNGSSTK